MVTPEEIYSRYIIKVEKNGTNDYLSTDRGRFIELYNELAPRTIKWYLNNRDKDDLIDIQVLLIDDEEIFPEKSHLDHQDFPLPKDFLSWSFVRATASKGKCKREDIRLYQIDDENRGMLTNEFFSPSFDFREAPYTYSENFIKVYREEGMNIDKVILSYYRYPTRISLIDPENPESSFTNTPINLPDEVLNRIISAMVGDFKINNSDPSFQADKLRQNENLV